MNNPLGINPFADTPIRNNRFLKMVAPNATIEIYRGVFTIKVKEQDYACDGRIFYKWFPYCTISFDGEILENAFGLFSAVDAASVDLLINGQAIGKGRILDTRSDSTFIVGSSAKIHINDSSIPVSEIYFPVINMREHLGDSIREENQLGAEKGRISFADNEYQFHLDKHPNYKEARRQLLAESGFLDTYTGKIQKKSGSMTAGNTANVFECLTNMIYFLNGQRTGIPILFGIHEGEVVWTEYRSISGYAYKYVPSWSDVAFLGNLDGAWRMLRELFRNPDSKDVLNTAIYWYNQVNNNNAGLEGTVILAQTALELFYNWLIIEQRKIIVGSDAINLNASNKIRLLLSVIGQATEIPEKFTEIKNLQLGDGPESFVYIRNALVHGNEEKRKRLLEIPTTALFEATHLATWYIELCILFILGYNGPYNNRSKRIASYTTGELVPWTSIGK